MGPWRRQHRRPRQCFDAEDGADGKMLDRVFTYPIGIDIQRDSVQALQFRSYRKGLAIRGARHYPRSDRSAEALMPIFDTIKREACFSGKRVVIHLPPDQLFVYPIRIQSRSPVDIEPAIIETIQKRITFPIQSAIIDYSSLTASRGGTDEYSVTVVGAHREQADPYVKAISDAGLVLEAIDFQANSLLRLHRFLNLPLRHTAVFCQVGWSESQLAAATTEDVIGFRTIDWGIGALLNKLRSCLSTNPGDQSARYVLSTHGVSFESANEAAIDSRKDIDAVSSDPRRTAYQVLSPRIDELVYELQRLVNYVRSESSQTIFDGLFLYGHAAECYQIDRYIEKRLNIATRPVNPLNHVDFDSDEVDATLAGALAPSFGLALRRIPWL
jgi:type IV pilus assembly protein PilM